MSGRLVAIDLDGTLIDESLVISRPDREAIADAMRAGWTVCIASGRMIAASKPFATELGLTTPIIALQGAAVYEIASGKALLSTILNPEVALRAYDDLKARGFHLQLYFGDNLYLDEVDERARFYIELARVEPVVVPDLRLLLTGPPPETPGPMKVLGIDAAAHVQETIPILAEKYGPSTNVFRSLPMYLEVTDANANKGFALHWVASHLGIDLLNTAAIGDADNDVPMFRVAARSFAVANATDAAKGAAGTIVATRGRGVAEALQKLTEAAHENV